MMLRAPDTEALYEGYAQKGFGVSSLDGSSFPLGLKATSEPIEIPRSLWGVETPDDYRIKALWIKKHNNPKQKNTSDNQQPSGGQAEVRGDYYIIGEGDLSGYLHYSGEPKGEIVICVVVNSAKMLGMTTLKRLRRS
jgi:hypothetical protein